MKGEEFIEKLKHEFKCETDTQLAKVLGRSVPTISGWKRRKNISAMVVARTMRELGERVQGETEALREQLRANQVAHS